MEPRRPGAVFWIVPLKRGYGELHAAVPETRRGRRDDTLPDDSSVKVDPGAAAPSPR